MGGALLSLSSYAGRGIAGLVEEERLCRKDQCLILRPSNAVVEASDYLSSKHDWLQLDEETTSEISRVVYEPRSVSCQSMSPGQNEVSADVNAHPEATVSEV